MGRPVRDGSLLLEQMAQWKLVQESASFSASSLVQILMAPETIAEWASRAGVNTSLVYNVLSGTKTSRPVLEALSRRLGVPVSELSDLIERPTAELASRVPEKPPFALRGP